MKAITVAQMREMDRRMIEEADTPAEELMERAGAGVAFIVEHLFDFADLTPRHVHIIAGRGNNGGDAFVTARHLAQAGMTVTLWLAGASTELKGESLQHFSRLKAMETDVEIEELRTREDWENVMDTPPAGPVLVDGVLGVGVSGPPRGPAAWAIQYINAHSSQAYVVSIDVPSGLDGDTGKPLGEAVMADITVTMGFPKVGLLEPTAIEYVGSLEVADLGIPPEISEAVAPTWDREFIYGYDLMPLFKRRPRASHKGDYGRILLIGGAVGYTGAIGLAARAAIRSGAGLVTVLTPRSIVPIVATLAPECMVRAGAETAEGSLSPECWNGWLRQLDHIDALLIGPGLTRSDASLVLVKRILADVRCPIVLDADAIAVLARQTYRIESAKGPVVITPHPGELAMLLGQTVAEIQNDRYGAALRACDETKATVILKGAGTIVTAPDKKPAVNLTGNPGMATGGAGDVLAGMLVALLGQGMAPYDAARAAVFLHGKAGDLAAWRLGQIGLIASDLIDEIPHAFRLVAGIR